jgi:hypothetical protein
MLFRNHNAVRKKPRIKTRLEWRPIHDKSVGNSGPGLTPPRLRRLRHGIFMQPGRTVLVRRGDRAAADAGRRRGLPVPGVPEEDGEQNTIILNPSNPARVIGPAARICREKSWFEFTLRLLCQQQTSGMT